MVAPVADFLQGNGHPVRRARDVGLADEEDSVLPDYAIVEELVIVTFDRDFRSSARRKHARCVHIHPPERTAKDRVARHYREVVRLIWSGAELVTLPADGPPF
jgi:predicted nuclease of predicted toxin-antitoxin system